MTQAIRSAVISAGIAGISMAHALRRIGISIDSLFGYGGFPGYNVAARRAADRTHQSPRRDGPAAVRDLPADSRLEPYWAVVQTGRIVFRPGHKQSVETVAIPATSQSLRGLWTRRQRTGSEQFRPDIVNALPTDGRRSCKPPPFRTREWQNGSHTVISEMRPRGPLRFVVHRSPIARRRFVLLEHNPSNLN